MNAHPGVSSAVTALAITLSTHGTSVAKAGELLSIEQLDELEGLQELIADEAVSNGDDDSSLIFVKRFVIDKPGEPPTLVNRPHSDALVRVMRESALQRHLALILKSPGTVFHLRRCQLHRIPKGAHLGLHLDVESNPANEYAVTIFLKGAYKGGEFVVHSRNAELKAYAPQQGDILFTSCSLPHEVRPVLAGDRRTLTCFFSRSSGINARDPLSRCLRPNCRWCGEHLRSRVDQSPPITPKENDR